LALAAGYDSQTVEGAPISFGFGLMLQPRSTKRTKAHEIRRTQQPQWSRRSSPQAGTDRQRGRDGRIFIELINGPFLFQLKGTQAEYKAGLDRAIANGWLWMHESGTYVKFTEAGAEPFAWALRRMLGLRTPAKGLHGMSHENANAQKN
jgi:hypothetical protein